MYFALQSCFLPSLKNNVVFVANMHNIYHTEIFTLNQCTSKQKLTYTLFSSNQLVYVLSSLVYPINFQLNTTAIIGITYIQVDMSSIQQALHSIQQYVCGEFGTFGIRNAISGIDRNRTMYETNFLVQKLCYYAYVI